MSPPHLNESKDFHSQASSEAERRSPALKSLKNPCKKMLKHEKKKEEETAESWNHHVKTWSRMPCCEAVVCDIKRHLRVHIKRGQLDTDGHAEIMRHGKRKFKTSPNNPEIRGRKPRTRQNKWCPVPGCKTICTRLDKHPSRAHQMKIGSVPYKMYIREAKLYMGMMELDDGVLAEAQPSTSASPQPAEEPEPAACEDDASSSEETNICPPSAWGWAIGTPPGNGGWTNISRPNQRPHLPLYRA